MHVVVVISSASHCHGIAARAPPWPSLFVFVVLLMGVVHFHRSVDDLGCYVERKLCTIRLFEQSEARNCELGLGLDYFGAVNNGRHTSQDDGASDRGAYAFESIRSGKLANQVSSSHPGSDSSSELLVKEVECGNIRNSSGRTWENSSAVAETSLSLSERRMVNESTGTSEKSFDFQQGSTNLQSFSVPSLSADLYLWALGMKTDANLKNSATIVEKISDLRLSGHPEHHSVYSLSKSNSVKSMKTVGDSSGWCQKKSSLISESITLGSKNGSRVTDMSEAMPSWSGFGGNAAEEKHHSIKGREHNHDNKTTASKGGSIIYVFLYCLEWYLDTG